jgi:hypothetical protein
MGEIIYHILIVEWILSGSGLVSGKLEAHSPWLETKLPQHRRIDMVGMDMVTLTNNLHCQESELSMAEVLWGQN